MIKRFQPKAFGQTDVGMVRKNNEDSFFLELDKGLMVVADGMGGHASGETASRMAVDVIRNYFNAPTTSGKTPLIGIYNNDFRSGPEQRAMAGHGNDRGLCPAA
jgi:protein phosphatase